MRGNNLLFSLKNACSVLLIVFLCYGSIMTGQTPISHSNALSALIQQADQTYARSSNNTMQHFFNNIPVNAAICMGLAMHGQKLLASQDDRYQIHYEMLRHEAHMFLGELARAHDFTNPFDGTPLTPQLLCEIFDTNASGDKNQWAVQNRLPNPGTVRQPMILSMVNIEPAGALPLKKNDSIRLLDQTADRVANTTNFQQPPPPVKNEPVKQPIAPGVILGRWQESYIAAYGVISEHETVRKQRFIDFKRGSGSDLYTGITMPGGENKFHVKSEKQIDPYTIEYSAVWDNPKGMMLYHAHGQQFKIRITRGQQGGIVLLRGKANVAVEMGYVKVGY